MSEKPTSKHPIFDELRWALAKLSPERQKMAVKLLQAVLELLQGAAEPGKDKPPTKE